MIPPGCCHGPQDEKPLRGTPQERSESVVETVAGKLGHVIATSPNL